MNGFPNRLKDLIKFNNFNKKDICKYLELNNETKIYAWLNGKNIPRFQTIIKLADLFCCSIDYLLGSTDNFTEIKPKNVPDFNIQFKKVLEDLHISQYKLLKDNIVSQGHLNSWFKDKMTPSTENIIKLANYLNVSIDYLVGRE